MALEIYKTLPFAQDKWNRLPKSNKTREQLIDEIKNHQDDSIQSEVNN